MLQGAFFDMNQLTGTLDPMVWGKPHIQACSVLGTKIQPAANRPRSDLHDQCRLSHFRSCASPSQRAIANVAFRACENTPTNTTCTYACAPGYRPQPGHKTILCGAGGMWLDVADAGCIFCRFCCNVVPDSLVPHASKKSKVACEGTDRNGIYLSGSFTTGLCDLDCDENYQLANTSKLEILCEFGSWSPPPRGGQCVPKTCTSPTKITNLAPSSCDGTPPKSACQYQCKAPFVTRSDNIRIVCVSGGLWSNLPASDKGCVCGDVPANLVPNASLAACARKAAPGETCRFDCERGYASARPQDLFVKCGDEGAWSWSPTGKSIIKPGDLCVTELNCWAVPANLVPNANTTHCEGAPRADLGNGENRCEVRCAETYVPEDGVYAELLCPKAGGWEVRKESKCVPSLCDIEFEHDVKTGSGDNWRLLSFRGESFWDNRRLPASIDDDPATDLSFDRCADDTYSFVGTDDFDVMCCSVSSGANAYVPVVKGRSTCPDNFDSDFKQCQPKMYINFMVRRFAPSPQLIVSVLTIGANNCVPAGLGSETATTPCVCVGGHCVATRHTVNCLGDRHEKVFSCGQQQNPSC